MAALAENEVVQRNSRKDSQEQTARGVIVTAGVILTLLLGVARETVARDYPNFDLSRAAIGVTFLLGALAAVSAVGALWPRKKYERLGAQAFATIKDAKFLTLEQHKVARSVLDARVRVAEKMDTLHEIKAKWLKISFVFLVGAFVGLVVQAAAYLFDTPDQESPATVVERCGFVVRSEHKDEVDACCMLSGPAFSPSRPS